MKQLVFGLLIVCTFAQTNANTLNSLSLGTSNFLGGLRNATSSATNYLSGAIERQRQLFHHVSDTATGYVTSAVEKPRNMLIHVRNVTTNYIDSAASRGLEFKMTLLLENLRARMPYGIPALGIPVLEPLKIDHYDFDIHSKEIGDIKGFVHNVTIYHLSTFVVQHTSMTLAGPTIVLNMTIPTIYATGYYNVSGLLGDTFPLYGFGPFDVSIYGSHFHVNTVLGYSGGMYMKSFDLDFSIDSMSLELNNLFKNEKVADLMNRMFGALAPDALRLMKPEILPQIQEYVAGRANDTIYHLTTGDMISILTGKSSFEDFGHLIASRMEQESQE